MVSGKNSRVYMVAYERRRQRTNVLLASSILACIAGLLPAAAHAQARVVASARKTAASRFPPSRFLLPLTPSSVRAAGRSATPRRSPLARPRPPSPAASRHRQRCSGSCREPALTVRISGRARPLSSICRRRMRVVLRLAERPCSIRFWLQGRVTAWIHSSPPIRLGALKTSAQLIEVPQSVSVVGRKQLDAQNAQSVSEALRYVPGVAIETYGPIPRAMTGS